MTVTLAVSALCGVIIPALVDLTTKTHAPRWLKAGVALTLAGVAGAISTVTFTAGERWTSYVLAVAAAFVTTMSAHLTGYSNPIQRATARYGLGRAGSAIPLPAAPPSSPPPAPPVTV